MKRPVAVGSASALLDQKIKELGDWRRQTLAKVRAIIHAADPEIIEEWKWVKPASPGTPVFSHGGIVCTGETYKDVVKMTFPKGAALPDPSGLFNSSHGYPTGDQQPGRRVAGRRHHFVVHVPVRGWNRRGDHGPCGAQPDQAVR